MKISKLMCSIFLLASVNSLLAQEPKKDEKKIQEVITIEPEEVTPVANEDGTMPVDTMPTPQMPASEILQRAVNFVKIETTKYTKQNGVTTGSKAECVASFKYKPKELNPIAEVNGTITMHLSIEAKEGKYRYTITKLTHNATNADYSGGDVYAEVPKCGSMKIPPDMWNRIRQDAIKDASSLASDVKSAMKLSSAKPLNPDEW